MSSIYSTLKHPLFNLTASQKLILPVEKGAVMVSGAAGSGKTTALIHRLGFLFSQNRASGSDTLFVTPNDASSRYVNETLINLGFYDFRATSFDELCLEILRQAVEFRLLVKDYLINFYHSGPVDQKQLLKESLAHLQETQPEALDWNGLDIQLYYEQIKSWKHNLVLPLSRWILLPDSLKERISVARHDNKTMELVYEYYEKYRIKNKLLDTEDLYYTVLNLLYSCESLKDHYTNNLKNVFLDDFQVVNSLQFELIQLFIPVNENINLSFDPHLIVNKDLFHKIEGTFNFKKIQLTDSFRIMDFQSSAGLPEYSGVLKQSAKYFQNHVEETEFITQTIQNLLIQGVTPGNIAILVKSGDRIPLIEANLIKRKITYQLENEFPFYLKTPYLNLLRCLRFAITDLKIENGIFPENDRQTKLYYEDLEIMGVLFNLDLKRTELDGIKKKTNWFESSISRELNLLPRTESKARFKMLTFNSFIIQLKSKLNQPATEVLSWMLEKYGTFFYEAQSPVKFRDTMQPLFELFKSTHNCIAFMDRVYLLVKAYKAKKQSLFQSELTILTIAECPGRQWDYVFLSHPLTNSEDLETNKQLYLGAGRAVKELIFTCSNPLIKDRGNQPDILSKQYV